MAFTNKGYSVASKVALASIASTDLIDGAALLVQNDGWYEYDESATFGDVPPVDTPATGYWKKIGSTIERSEAHTTASLADEAIEDFTFTNIGSQGILKSIELDRSAWIILYCDAASRTADASRVSTNVADPGSAPTPESGSGVIVEVYLDTAGTQKITDRGGRIYFNNDTPLANAIYAKVVNLSGATSTVQIDINTINLN